MLCHSSLTVDLARADTFVDELLLRLWLMDRQGQMLRGSRRVNSMAAVVRTVFFLWLWAGLDVRHA